MIPSMKHLFFFLLFLFCAACAHRNPLSDFRFQTVTAPPYVLASWHRITEPGQPLKIYIEGDGNAFDADGHPTDNPTPSGEFMRRLAAGDSSPNVAYLGRPCQYLQAGACSQTDWTDGRFSQQVIASMDQSVHTLMKKARTDQVILIGFSGGAQAAGLIAVRHPEHVKQIITIAGVLDIDAWTTYHQDAPLSASLNLKDSRDIFLKIPQIHYAGARDTVVPPALIRDFVGDAAPVVVVPKASHGKGFDSVYDAVYKVR